MEAKHATGELLQEPGARPLPRASRLCLRLSDRVYSRQIQVVHDHVQAGRDRVATVDWYRHQGSPFSHYFVRPDDVVRTLQEIGFSRVAHNRLEIRGYGEARTGDLLRRAATAISSVRNELRTECEHTQYLEDDDAKRDSPLR